MRKIMILTIIVLTITTILTGCSGSPGLATIKGSDKTKINNNFSEQDAINMVIKEYPDFPSKPGEAKTMEVKIGGGEDPNAKVKVQLTTKVEKNGENTYTVMLTKVWDITINGIQPVSYWKYRVDSDRVTLIESKNNDNTISIIK